MLLTREFSRGRDKGNFRLEDIDEDSAAGSADSPKERNVTVSRFMPTSRRIVQFSSGRSPPPGAKVVYIDGSFDLFHVGHVDILKVRWTDGVSRRPPECPAAPCSRGARAVWLWMGLAGASHDGCMASARQGPGIPALALASCLTHSSHSLALPRCTSAAPQALTRAPPQAARSKGDFLLVGIHTDEDVAERRGPHQPIMNLHERALSVLACKYADEVIIGARWGFKGCALSKDTVGGCAW